MYREVDGNSLIESTIGTKSADVVESKGENRMVVNSKLDGFGTI